MLPLITRRKMLVGMAGAAGAAATGLVTHSFAQSPVDEVRRAAYRRWLASLPAAPEAELTRHGLVATELNRWHVMEANQGAAVDGEHFYGIGNHALVKHRKDTGERVAEWFGPRGGPIVHFNAGWVEGERLVLAHSNFPQMPMAGSLEIHDTRNLQPLESYSFGMQLGNLNWAVRHQGYWWTCLANYSNQGAVPGFDQRATHLIQYNDNWQQLQSWLFPPQVIAAWGESSCSGGDFGEDGFLYVTGHDEAELYVLRLPKQGVTLEYVTTIDVPFEGQSWAWDRSVGGERVIYGISRARHEVIAARIPAVPATLL
jgi:hypothetical protein